VEKWKGKINSHFSIQKTFVSEKKLIYYLCICENEKILSGQGGNAQDQPQIFIPLILNKLTVKDTAEVYPGLVY